MIEATIDESLIPEGYKFVAVKMPDPGELFVAKSGVVSARSYHISVPRIVVEKLAPEPPVVRLPLETGWVAKSQTGGWYWFKSKPNYFRGAWRGSGSVVPLASVLNFSFPECDHRESLHRVEPLGELWLAKDDDDDDGGWWVYVGKPVFGSRMWTTDDFGEAEVVDVDLIKALGGDPDASPEDSLVRVR